MADSLVSTDIDDIPEEDKQVLKVLGFDVAAMIGNGSYGYVFGGVCNTGAYKKTNDQLESLHGMPCAIKMLTKGRNDIDQEFYAEAKTMCDLDHPNIVEIYAICKGPTYGYIVMEYMNGGDIHDLINSLQGDNMMDEFTAVRIIRQTVAGLRYLHSKNIVHGDFHSGNIMLSNQNNMFQCKLIDFGFSKKFVNMMSNVRDLRSLGRILGQVMDKSKFSRPDIPVRIADVLERIKTGRIQTVNEVEIELNRILPNEPTIQPNVGQPSNTIPPNVVPPSNTIAAKFVNFFRRRK